jgi:hypothetical protein
MKYLLTLCMGFFMLLSCNNKSSQSAAIATDEPEVNEDTLFRVIDLANNLKPCSDSLLLSDIVEDVEYVKLEAADNALVGEMYKGCIRQCHLFFLHWQPNSPSYLYVRPFHREIYPHNW